MKMDIESVLIGILEHQNSISFVDLLVKSYGNSIGATGNYVLLDNKYGFTMRAKRADILYSVIIGSVYNC